MEDRIVNQLYKYGGGTFVKYGYIYLVSHQKKGNLGIRLLFPFAVILLFKIGIIINILN